MAAQRRASRKGRQPDLLSRIPRHAIIDALAAYPSVRGAGSARDGELTALVRQTLTPTELEKLQTDWRYGKRVSTALFLCSDRPQVTPSKLGAAVRAALDAATPPDQSDTERRMRITTRETTRFDAGRLIEISFRYGHAFSFINLDEQEVIEHESRYGFIWIATQEEFVAISGEEHVIAELRPALEEGLGIALLRCSLGKRTVEQVFPVSTAAALSQFDPVTQWRIRYSGARLADNPKEFAELLARDEERERLGGLYTQQIAKQSVNVNVTAPTARLTTTRPVAAEALRMWEIPKLTALARALHQIRRDRPTEFYDHVDLSLESVPAKYRARIQTLVTAVADARSRKRDAVPLPASAEAGLLAESLPADSGYLVARPYCESCADTVLARCSRCAATIVSKGLSGCGACGTRAFVCEQGHDIALAAWKDGLTFHPAQRLVTWISAGLDELRLRPGLNTASESIRIRGRELLYSSRRPLPAGEYSVLQADVRHSTVMRMKEPVRYRELQGRVRDGLDSAARTRRGDMASWGGDGGFWLFHTPEEAMQATVELRRELDTHGFDRNVVRIAVARGAITLQQGEYDGDVMHLASRLQKHATSGARIVVDTPTAQQLSRHLDLDDGHPVSSLDPAYKARRDMFFKVRTVRDSLFGRSAASH